jgi:hypothetical protein
MYVCANAVDLTDVSFFCTYMHTVCTVCMCVQIYKHVCVYIYIYIVCVCVYVRIHGCMYVHTSMYVYVLVHVFLELADGCYNTCIYVCM